LLLAPCGTASGEHDLDEDLFAPFADVTFNDGSGAGHAPVALAPVRDQVADCPEVRVDGQLVPAGVVAGR
jgi:hypothetical protein